MDNNSISYTDLQPALNGDNYYSHTDHTPLINRLFPSCIFYAKFLIAFLRASKLAKQGIYDNTACRRDTLYIFRCLENVGVRFEIENMMSWKNLQTPCVFISNHMSTLETLVLPAIILPNRNTTYVIYKGILRWPIFNAIMLSQNPIVVSKTNPREDFTHVISEGYKTLNQDMSIIVFPQGKRITKFRAQDFNSIGVKIAKHAKVPVIPIAVKSDAWSNNGFPIPYFGRINPAKTVHISFGNPIYINGNGRKEHDLVVNFIQDKLMS